MKKIKVIIPSIAILTGSLVAFASRPHQACTLVPQYYYNGVGYVPAGVLGRDYFCANGTGTCTYFTAGNTYQPCQMGVYTPLNVTAPQKKK